ncbi:MAG: hypothetical protein JXA79_12410 [Deltaproteobacteria bacterium]|nr:hypothetical protein [Deltaproteobacteria bacterium]
MKDDYSYVRFPLCLFQEFFTNGNDAFNLISGFGIINMARSLKAKNIEEVARQLMYYYYNNKTRIPGHLLDMLQVYINSGDIILDEDYRGFGATGEFAPEGEVFSIMQIFQKNPKFLDEALLLWQLSKTVSDLKDKKFKYKLLNVTIGSTDDIVKSYEKALTIQKNFEDKYGKDSWSSVKTDMLFEFRDSGKDFDLLRAYLAIKSIIGPHQYTATTRKVILMRMMGCKSNEALNDFLKNNKTAREYYNMFSRSDKALRYHFDKLFEALLARGFIQSKIFERKVSRKLFISHVLNYDELATEIINFHNKRKHKKDEQQAIDKIRATI